MPTETLIMKDSKIDWIGKIPSDWQIGRIKYFTNLNGRIGWQGLTTEDYKDEGPYLITGVDFLNGSIDWDSCTHITEKRWIEANTIQIKNGDLLITKDGTVGKVAIVSGLIGKASLNSGVLLVRPQGNIEYYNRYIYYQLLSDVFWAWFEFNKSGNSTIIHLYQQDFSNLYVLLPNIKEQQTIANFLDEKCKKIDKVANEIGEQIQILEEYKKSLITETITKGLDENVPLKDSGINYLGKIPVHYKVIRLKYLLSGITDGTHGTFDRYAEGEYLLSAKNVFEDGLHIEENESLISEKDYREIVKNGFPRKGDVLVCCVGTIGRTCVYDIDKPFAFQRSVVFLRPNNKVKSKYLQYLMQAESSQIQMQLYANASAQAGIYMGTLQTIIVIEVPIDEQEQIIGYLDKECEKIDKTINDKKEQLETIKKYKKSLIYEYVTGKKRVAC